MDEKGIKKAVSEAVAAVMDDKLKAFYVERERHYRHHQWIERMMQWTESCKSTILQTITKCFVVAVIGLVVLGFVMWGSKSIPKAGG